MLLNLILCFLNGHEPQCAGYGKKIRVGLNKEWVLPHFICVMLLKKLCSRTVNLLGHHASKQKEVIHDLVLNAGADLKSIHRFVDFIKY